MPSSSDGTIFPTQINVKGQDWTVYSIGGTPAQVVQHGVLEVVTSRPDLVVAGINYGESLGQSITISGNLGAAMVAAALGVPALAVSLQLLEKAHFYNYELLDFSAAAFFTQYFAQMIITHGLPEGTNLLEVDVPACATTQTPWRITSLAKHRYYQPEATWRKSLNDESSITFHSNVNPSDISHESDIQAVLFDRVVSATPLTLDMTARINLEGLNQKWHNTNMK